MIALETQDTVLARFVAELEEQSPYALDLPPPQLSAHRADAIESARLTWAGRVVDEYRSVVRFSQLLTLLADAEAPFSALCSIQRLIGDELRHARLCAQVVEWLGGFGGLQIELDGMGLPPTDESPRARAYEVVVRELVVAERESLKMLCAYRNATSEPAVRRVFEILVRDESRHFVAGRRLQKLLEASFPQEIAPVRTRVDLAVQGDLATMHRIYRASADGGPGRALGASLTPEEVPF